MERKPKESGILKTKGETEENLKSGRKEKMRRNDGLSTVAKGL